MNYYPIILDVTERGDTTIRRPIDKLNSRCGSEDLNLLYWSRQVYVIGLCGVNRLEVANATGTYHHVSCRYEPGDKLYVKEWFRVRSLAWPSVIVVYARVGDNEREVTVPNEAAYAQAGRYMTAGRMFQPALMPRWAARTMLKVVAVLPECVDGKWSWVIEVKP